MMDSLRAFFEEGGWVMWPILMVIILVWGFAIERVIYLFFKASPPRDFIKRMEVIIMRGDLNAAIKESLNSDSALGRIVHAGLLRVNQGSDEVQSAIDETALRELPKIEKITPYLSVLSNVSMLLGLLGTILGMISAFAAVANADPSEKSAKLAAGISVAMNTTAFGLIGAIPGLLWFAVLQGRTQKLSDEISEGSVRVLNLVIANEALLVKGGKKDDK